MDNNTTHKVVALPGGRYKYRDIAIGKRHYHRAWYWSACIGTVTVIGGETVPNRRYFKTRREVIEAIDRYLDREAAR